MEIPQRNIIRKIWLKIRKNIPEEYLVFLSQQPEKLNHILLKRKYSKLGFLSYHPVFSEDLKKYLLQKENLSEKQKEIKYISHFLRKNNNHQNYDLLLKAFIPKLLLDYDKAEFIGEGQAKSSLDTYRKISIDQNIFFEKVYFNSYQNIEKLTFLSEFIFPLLKNKLQIPSIKNIYKGNIISSVYWEFLILKEISKHKQEETLKEFSLILYQVSIEKHSFLRGLKELENYRNFNLHYQYVLNLDLSKRYFKSRRISFSHFEKSAGFSKPILTHADLHQDNIFQNRILIDWDHFGYFPIGFEQAFLFFRMLENHSKSGKDFYDWMKDFTEKINKEDRADFERNFLFFLMVFSIRRIEKNKLIHSKELLRNLTFQLQNYTFSAAN